MYVRLRHSLSRARGRWTCTCPDQKFRKAKQGLECKHITAIKAGVKPKRLAALAAELPAPSGGAVSLSQLAPGDNPGKSVFVKVVAPLPQMRSKHLRFVVVDAQERLIGLSLYALPKGLVQPDATLELTAPHLLKVEARPWDQPGPAAGFHVLRVEEPRAQLRVNGAGVVPRSERQRGGGGGGGGQ